MSELRLETWSMPGADLGRDNPLPPLKRPAFIFPTTENPQVPREMRRNMELARVSTVLPYTTQDGYDRELHPAEFRTAVLENEYLRAVFLLERGGRLWSLTHKPSGRELLYVNPVFQPANLALRNAWFSGGVEWNIGIVGHSPFTCSPVFAARVEGPEGNPMLRLYEWERIRQVPFQMDIYLPDGSPVLLVHVRLVNPHGHDVPMYWWSNIAVPEEPGRRVVVPAESAWVFGYGAGGLRQVDIPQAEGTDVSYAVDIGHSADFFFNIHPGSRPWIAALDAGGRGLVQTSTGRLKGRKLFAWGNGRGGRRWQDFLSVPGQAYLEIQAGMTVTQRECLPMPAGEEWTWLEAYGMLETDPDAVHGEDWGAAIGAVEEALEHLIPQRDLEAARARMSGFISFPPLELLQRGSGWGALERLRREASGERPFCGEELVFDDQSLGVEQESWSTLLKTGSFPPVSAETGPQGWMVQEEWRPLLRRAVENGSDGSAAAWTHLGLMAFHAGDLQEARQAWERSLELVPDPVVMRNLAVLAGQEGDLEESARLLAAACRIKPDLPQLAVECGQAMISAGWSGRWLELLAELPDFVRNLGRMRLLRARAELETGDYRSVEEFLAAGVQVDDLREGDTAVSDLWFDLQERRLSSLEGVDIDDALKARARKDFPLPPQLDFRMTSEP